MADRSTFLARIREQAARGRAHRVAINPQATAEAGYVGGGSDLVASLLAEWTAVGGQGVRLPDATAVREWLTQFVRDRQIRSAIRWEHPLLSRLEIDTPLAEAGVNVSRWHDLSDQADEARWNTTFAAELGITSVDFAVAETGSLVLCSSHAQGRACSLLPPVYVALVEPSQIVPDLFDVFAALENRKADLPSNLVFVTGPSKTGDIELKLTTGVHGPGHVFLVVVET